ncbi:uncharacterized protein LOC131435978 [Malaya genurostris]|uniref:uncharacterized protein LOC131435978 n=1 Tax=Malaya genurostris TaxID=325434 RepID=UPI0026F4005A|nr:uncharacterized protein LOC131435978 [Malaya genurostris]
MTERHWTDSLCVRSKKSLIKYYMRTNSEIRESSDRGESSSIFKHGSGSSFGDPTAFNSVVDTLSTSKINTMAEAQRLIGISLAKIAQSRVCRGGVSLHKNLLVATVLQKARYIFMEEAYHIVHGHYLQQNKCMEFEMEKQRNAAAIAASVNNVGDDDSCSESEDSDELESYASSENNDESDNDDKENSPPSQTTDEQSSSVLYFDMDVKKVETTNVDSNNKRRRDVSEWETDEAVQSILPKRIKSESDSVAADTGSEASIKDIVSSDEVFALPESANSQTVAEDLSTQSGNSALQHTPSVESIDRITSLVSIFSFGNLTRSVSTPDFCATQAKDSENSLTQLQHSQRGYLTMTV